MRNETHVCFIFIAILLGLFGLIQGCIDNFSGEHITMSQVTCHIEISRATMQQLEIVILRLAIHNSGGVVIWGPTDFLFSENPDGVTIDGIEPGNNYSIHVAALDVENHIVCDGESGVFNAVAGETADAGHINLGCLLITFEKTYGELDDEWSFSVQQTMDEGYIIAGTDDFGSGDDEVYLIKTDEDGNELWSRTFGGTGREMGGSVQQTTDGGYIIAADTYSYGAGGLDVYLIKTDKDGNELWSRTYGGTGYEDWGYNVLQTRDGGYIFAGTTDSFGAGLNDIYVLKMDESGNELWSRTFGGTDNDQGYYVQQLADDSYIIAGSTASYGAGELDMYLIKIDASGSELWSQTFGGIGMEEAWGVQQTADGGYIISGNYDSSGDNLFDVLLVKTDEKGIELWSKMFGGTGSDYAVSVQQTSDNGYIIGATTSSFGAGGQDIYLIKTDQHGIELWSRTYGGPGDDSCGFVRQTSDYGYIITGMTTSYGAGEHDVYLIKTDSEGEIWSAENG